MDQEIKTSEFKNGGDAHKYVRAIRNSEKKAYAMAFLDYLANGSIDDEPLHKLSFMGAQAVRFRLYELVK